MKGVTDMEDKKDIKEPLDLLTSLSTFPLLLEVWDSMYCTASSLAGEKSYMVGEGGIGHYVARHV